MADQLTKQANQAVAATDPNAALFAANGSNLNAPTILPVNKISGATDLNIPQPTYNSTPSDALVAGVAEGQKGLDQYIKDLTPATTALDTQNQSILDSIASLTAQDTGKTQALAQAKIDAGATDLSKTLTDLNGQITVGNAAYQKLALDAQARKDKLEANSQGVTTGVLAGQQGAIERQLNSEQAVKAAELGMIAARAQAVSGNLSTALQIAQNAVDAKYAPIEDNLKIRQAQLAAIQPALSKQQAIQAQALERKYNDEKQAVADKKAQESQIQSIMIEAAKSGADNETLNKIQNSESITDAITNAGESLGSEYRMKVQQQAFDNNVALQKLAIDRAQLSIAQQNANKQAGLTPADLIAYAQQYAATGNIPSGIPQGTFGSISQVAGSLPKAPGTIVSSATGVVPPTSAFSNAQSDGVSATYNLITNVLPNLKAAFNNVTTNAGTGFLNALHLRTGDVTQFNSQNTQFLNALLLANSGKVVSETELQRYKGLLPGLSTLSKGNGNKQLDELQKQLTDKFNSYLANNQLSVVGYDPKNPQAMNVGDASKFDQ